jgi:hypothetical protein
MGLVVLGHRRKQRTRRTRWSARSPEHNVSICDASNVRRDQSYRFIVRGVIWNLGAIHNVGQRILLQPRLRRIGDGTGSQAHDAVANLESGNAVADPAHGSDDVLAEDSRELVGDEQAGVSASLVVGVESWCIASVIYSTFMFLHQYDLPATVTLI